MIHVPPTGPRSRVLKRDLFGSVSIVDDAERGRHILRDVRPAPWWTRPVARRLARREADILQHLQGIDGIPQLIDFDGDRLRRSFMAGRPMQEARPHDPAYFAAAQRLVFRLHQRGVTHNDTAKEPNWLVQEGGEPGLIDFQLAQRSKQRGRWFRTLAREDLRHLLKHKRSYAAAALTARQRRILATPAWTSRAWARTVKPAYLFVTRKLLRWADREGAGDRGAR